MKNKNLNLQKNILSSHIINNRLYLGLSKSKQKNVKKEYLTGFRHSFCIFDINQMVINLKNSLKIISKFNELNKTIVFVGFPKFEKKNFYLLLNKTNHYYIPSKTWINGILSGKKTVLSHFKYKKLGRITQLKKKPDLIVIYNENSSETNAIKESLNFNIPVISFSLFEFSNLRPSYQIIGNFDSKEFGNIYYSLLNNILLK